MTLHADRLGCGGIQLLFHRGTEFDAYVLRRNFVRHSPLLMSAHSNPVRIALIGVSGYGRIYLEMARERRDRGEIQIVAAVVINPQEEAANVAELTAHGAEIFSDYQEMLQRYRGRIDLCLVPTGIHWHARMTIAALEAGANVLVEKPLTGSWAEVQQIRETERKCGRFVAVGFQDCYQPGTLALKAELDQGVIGELKSVRFLGIWPRPRRYFTRNNWAGRLSVDGAPVLDSPLNNAFAHFVMLSLFLTNSHRAAVESAELMRAHPIESFDTAVVRARSEHGVALWFGVTHSAASPIEPVIEIVGSNGQASWRYEAEARWQANDGRSARIPLTDITGARRAMFDAVFARLTEEQTHVCTTEMAGWHTALIEQIHQHAGIITLPHESLTPVGAGVADQVLDVRGLREALCASFQNGRSLEASGFDPDARTTSARAFVK